ncbi:MAG: hypothetical protein AAF654_10250 [Myxococcota bacterium]
MAIFRRGDDGQLQPATHGEVRAHFDAVVAERGVPWNELPTAHTIEFRSIMEGMHSIRATRGDSSHTFSV